MAFLSCKLYKVSGPKVAEAIRLLETKGSQEYDTQYHKQAYRKYLRSMSFVKFNPEDRFLILPLAYTTILLVVFWMTGGFDFSSFDWTVGALAVGFFYAAPFALHDKVLKVGQKLGKGKEDYALWMSRRIRYNSLVAGVFFIIQPFLTIGLGSSYYPTILELWDEFFAIASLAAATLYLGRFYNLMEELPLKEEKDDNYREDDDDRDDKDAPPRERTKGGVLTESNEQGSDNSQGEEHSNDSKNLASTPPLHWVRHLGYRPLHRFWDYRHISFKRIPENNREP